MAAGVPVGSPPIGVKVGIGVMVTIPPGIGVRCGDGVVCVRLVVASAIIARARTLPAITFLMLLLSRAAHVEGNCRRTERPERLPVESIQNGCHIIAAEFQATFPSWRDPCSLG